MEEEERKGEGKRGREIKDEGEGKEEERKGEEE